MEKYGSFVSELVFVFLICHFRFSWTLRLGRSLPRVPQVRVCGVSPFGSQTQESIPSTNLPQLNDVTSMSSAQQCLSVSLRTPERKKINGLLVFYELGLKWTPLFLNPVKKHIFSQQASLKWWLVSVDMHLILPCCLLRNFSPNCSSIFSRPRATGTGEPWDGALTFNADGSLLKCPQFIIGRCTSRLRL